MNDAAGLTEVRVPDMGSFKDVAVIDILVNPGDSVAVDTPLVTLESEKASMDVPSTADGVVEKVHIGKGGTVNTGDLIATVRSAAAGATAPAAEAAAAPAAARPAPTAPAAAAAAPAAPRPADPPPATAPAAASPPAAPSPAKPPPGAVRVRRSQLGMPTSYRSDLAPIDEPGFSRAHAGPSVRKFARELGVNLAQVAGHGFKDRITHEDVKAFVKAALAAPAAAAAAGAGAGPAVRAVVMCSARGRGERDKHRRNSW